jgi:antitoxin HicB
LSPRHWLRDQAATLLARFDAAWRRWARDWYLVPAEAFPHWRGRSVSGPTAATFTVILTEHPDGGFVANVPALPEVMTEGETLDETIGMATEAIRALLAYRADMGIAVPHDVASVMCRVTIDDW